MKEINLTLSTDETNTVLEALGNLPYVKSYGLIGKIQQQATGQLQTGSPSENGADVPEETEPLKR